MTTVDGKVVSQKSIDWQMKAISGILHTHEAFQLPFRGSFMVLLLFLAAGSIVFQLPFRDS